MGAHGSKHSLSITAAKYRIRRQIGRLCVQRKREEDVQQSRPPRFFNITMTSVEASVAVNKKATIRAYLVPDEGTAATQLIEFEAEADVEHFLEFGNLKPGTLYRLKMYYVSNSYKRMLSSTGTLRRHEGRGILQSMKSDKVEGWRQNSRSTMKRGTTTGNTQLNNVVVRRATGGEAMEGTTGHYEELPDVNLPREGLPGEKPLGMPVNYSKKLEVRTLPADWKGKESIQRRTMTRTLSRP